MFSHDWFFHDWSDVGRVLTLGVASYAAMVLVLRMSGKRTLAKLNAFDLVVTVALGSVLATIALSSEVSLVEGLAAIVVLIAAQWAVSWASAHISLTQGLVRSEASVLFRDGAFDDEALAAVRLTRDEVTQSIRSKGFGDLEMVAAVVLESDGSLSVIGADKCHSASALPSQQPTLRPSPSSDGGAVHVGTTTNTTTNASTNATTKGVSHE
jgi:uncharacterized membrane protein YcaP (DUF421 family)